MLNASCDESCATRKVVAAATNHGRGKAVWGKHVSLWPDRLAWRVEQACNDTLHEEPDCPFSTPSIGMTLAGSDFYDMALGFLLNSNGYNSLRLNFQPKGGLNLDLKWHSDMSEIRASHP